MVGYQFISFPRRGKKFVFVFIEALLLYVLVYVVFVCLVSPMFLKYVLFFSPKGDKSAFR